MKRLLLALFFLAAVFSAYAVGQKGDVLRLPGGPTVYAGDSFGFRAEGRVGDPTKPGHGWITGTFVVKVEGRWVEARMGPGPHPAGK